MSEDYIGDILKATLPSIPTILGAITGATITYFVNKNKYRLDKSWEMRLSARNSIISELNLAQLYYGRSFSYITENLGGSRDMDIKESLIKARNAEARANEKFSESYSILGRTFFTLCKELLLNLEDKSDLEYEGGRIYDTISALIGESVQRLEAERNRDLPRKFR